MTTKEFKLLGTITSLRVADNGAVVSYRIATDRGYTTTRHQRFLRALAAEHDPQAMKQSNKNVTKPSEPGKIDIPTNLEAMSDDDTAADMTEEVEKS